MAEQITINIVWPEVGIQYHPESIEAAAQNRLFAFELGLNALAARAILERQQQGRPVPAVLRALVEACTFREL
jgi:citrate lyase beta subunit